MAKVLVIDDSDPIRALLRTLLAQLGHEVIEAIDGDSGVEKSRAEKPDLIILDMNLPKMTGWEIAPIIRSHPATQKIPIIALTADSSTEGGEIAHLAGCDRYMTKPIQAELLLTAISEILSK